MRHFSGSYRYLNRPVVLGQALQFFITMEEKERARKRKVGSIPDWQDVFMSTVMLSGTRSETDIKPGVTWLMC